jgi:hypothetical protein
MDRVYGSWDLASFSMHGRLAIMERRGHSGAREVIVIAQINREREEVIGVLINGATWRQSYGDDHTTTLNRGGR